MEMEPSERAARDYLYSALHAGPVDALDLRHAAASAGINGRQLERAKNALGFQSRPRCEDGRWEWFNPESKED